MIRTIVPQIGDVHLLDVFAYYDEPVLYGVRGTVSDHVYLGMLAQDDKEHDRRVWLFAHLTDTQYADLKSGALTLRDAFLSPHRGLCLQLQEARASGDVVGVRWVTDLADEMLPAVGALACDGGES